MHSRLSDLFENIRKVIVGKDDVIRMTITALVARGHVLIEDVPGLGKTMLAQALARVLGLSFSRIQFTSDLLPADITGSHILDEQDGIKSPKGMKGTRLEVNVHMIMGSVTSTQNGSAISSLRRWRI